MAQDKRVTIYVADDHPVFRQGLIQMVKARPEFELVGSSDSGRQALDEIADLRPDVAVLDIFMPDLDGPAVLRAIEQRGLPTRVVILSASADSTSVYDAVAQGAGAYLSKIADPETICETIATVARGETVVPAELQQGLIGQIRRRETSGRLGLSDREREVLTLTANGLSTAEVAKRLYISPATVKTHLHHIYKKLGVSDRAAAVAEAMRHGLVV